MQEEATSGAAPTSALPEVSQSHRFDAMGNRTLWNDAQNKRCSDSLYNEVNQLTQSKSYDTNSAPATLLNTTNYGYDAKGNLTATATTNGSGAASGSATYTYDDADRLTGIINPGSSKREFLYDGASRLRVSRNWSWQGGAWVPQSEKRRVYLARDVVQERDGSNVVTANYTRKGNLGGILSRSTSVGSVYFGYDGSGNVMQLTDNTGTIVGTYAYDAFGNTTAMSGAAASANPYRFSTKEDVGGLYYYGFRFYSPGMGRWLNRDPANERGGFNLYGFAANSPVNWGDDYGQDLSSWWQGVKDDIKRVVDYALFDFAQGNPNEVSIPTGDPESEIPYLEGTHKQFNRAGANLADAAIIVESSICPATAGASLGSSGIQILEHEGNLVIGAIKVAKGEARFTGTITREGDTIFIRGAHVEGDATWRELRQAAKDYGREKGAEKVVIEGGRRTTGKNPGHAPKPVTVMVN